MACIRVISTTTIHAPSLASGDLTRKIHLTPWDIVSFQVEMNQNGILFHNPKEATDTTNQNIQHLKHSLSSTLAFFPPFAGRLIIKEHEDNNNTASSFILCNNVGVLFVHATAENTSVDDILRPNYVPPIVDSFFPLNGVRNYEGTTQPLLAVQVTELDDGIFIGVAINHVVADGKSFWHFINSWAEISRGFQKISNLPSLDRWFPDNIQCPIRFPFSKEDKQHSKNSDPQYLPPVRIFHFTQEKIAELKSKANAEANSDKISSLQALLSHHWLTVIRCQHIEPHEEILCFIAIDVRQRMVPSLPENYFGNAIRVGAFTMKAREVLEGGMGKFALEMNKMIDSHSDYERIKSHYESWVKTPSMHGSGSPSLSSSIKVFGTINSPRFNVYGNDFGWGKPVAVRSGCSYKNNGAVTLFSGAEEGSIDIEVCLPYDILEAIGNDPDFIH